MSINVVFCKRGHAEEVGSGLGNCYVLYSDNWDDSGYKTYFRVLIYKDGEKYGPYGRKILFRNQDEINSSSSFLETILSSRKFINMIEISNNNQFISLGYEYLELKKIFADNDDYIKILKVLNDVIYLENIENTSSLLALKEHPAFEKSLCRDQSSKKVLEEGKELLFGVDLDENRFDFEFNYKLNNKNFKYLFNFNAIDGLPHRINVLIGKNGSGKSQTLIALSQYLLNNEVHSVDKHPAFIANLMVFAYSPYENFVVPRRKRKYDIDYKYLGLKRPKQIFDIEMAKLLESEDLYNIVRKLSENPISELEEKIEYSKLKDSINGGTQSTEELIDEIYKNCQLSKDVLRKKWKTLANCVKENIVDINTPKHMIFSSFKDIYQKDRNNLAHTIRIDDVLYRDKVFEYINKAFNCDAIGLKFLPSIDASKYQKQGFDVSDEYLLITKEVSANYTRELNFEEFEKKLYFFNDGNRIFLSSGQQTFVDLVINILSLIKPNSLILIDEPENTLHPNLEVDFMRILESVLNDNDFDSFAIIATHSATIVREIPREFVHIIKFDGSGEPVIAEPSIKTFGADIGTITNYIFDDIFKEEKPFENWFLNEKVNYETFEQFEEKYRTILNYDFLLNCKNSWSH